MLAYYFNHKGIIHYEFIAHGQILNQQCYLEVQTMLREFVGTERPGLWSDK